MVIGLVSLLTLVGCKTTEQTASNNVKSVENIKEQDNQIGVKEVQITDIEVAAETVVEELVVDPTIENKLVATEQVKTLASLIGKSSAEARSILGEPSTSKNLDGTDILLVDYYKLEYLNEIAKVEVIYNDDKKQVNFVSFTILSADDIDATKENLISTLTELYGESSIERIVDKKGKRNLNWSDDTLIYDLKYFENNISLDIYEADK